MKRSALISDEYRATQQWLHRQPQGYGGKGSKWAQAVVDLHSRYGGTSILDYGCGQGTLGRTARPLLPEVRWLDYDPAIKGKDRLPEMADIVVCTDVLEHIEPEKLDSVIAHLFSLSRRALFAVISVVPSAKTLPDGRGAHLTVQPATWWRSRMRADGFTLAGVKVRPSGKASKEWAPIFARE